MNEWYIEFWKSNKKLILTHLMVTIMILPFEILLLTVYTKKLFQSLQENNFKEFVRLFIWFILFLTILQSIYAWKEFLDNRITPKVQSFIRQKCMNRYITKTRDSFKTSHVMSTINSLPKYFYQNYESFFKFWIPLYTIFFFYIIYLLWLNLKVGILSVFVFTTLLVAFSVVFKKLSSFDNRAMKEQDELLRKYENVLLNCETVQAYNKENNEIENLKKYESIFEKQRITLVFYVDLVKILFIVILFIYLLSVFQYLYKNCLLAKKSDFPPWKFISFITVLFFVVRSIISLMNRFRHVVSLNGRLYNTSSLNFLNISDENEIPVNNYNIQFKNVSFSYPTNPSQMVVKKLNLQIPEQSNVFIKGKIGAGKSTIAKLLCRFYQPNDGDILLGGVNIFEIPNFQYKQLIFMMSQNTLLFSEKTVFENICYAYEKLPSKDILNQFDLPKSFLSVLDKKVIEHGVNLSGGQKRLIYIIRALLHPAKIVILDEPTDSLDKEISEYIYTAIRKLQKSKTVICISHDNDLEQYFDRSFNINS